MADVAGRELVFHTDTSTEQLVLTAALLSERGSDRRKELFRHAPDVFLVDEHRAAWAAMREADRRGFGFDPATLAKLSGGAAEIAFFEQLTRDANAPDDATLGFHVDSLLWDRQQHAALTGPIASLLEAIQKRESRDHIQGLVRAVAGCFEGSGRSHIVDPVALVRETMEDIRRAALGTAVFPTGIRGLDFYEDGTRRIVPGLEPGCMTVVTALPGLGKSTFVARLALEQARMKRKVLFGAWEMKNRTTLKLIACISLALKDSPEKLGDWSRKKLKTPSDFPGWLTPARERVLEERMHALSKYIRFMDNPFKRGIGQKGSTDRNLDAVHGCVSEAGCHVVIFDLWKRCLYKPRPDDEEEALERQQAMLEELDVHGVLVHQQRSKDVELRPDKRPTREGMKGSGAFTELPDNIWGIHRQGYWKPVPDDTLEVDILKQREGESPRAVEFDWNGPLGIFSGGRSVEYDQPSSHGMPSNNKMDNFLNTPTKGKQK